MTSLESIFTSYLETHSILVLGAAFIAGIVSSLLPCTLAMLPLLVGYIGAYSEDSKWAVFQQVFFFIIGLSVTMTALGIAASLLGVAFGTIIGKGWYYAIGILSILMALQLLEIIHIPLPKFMSKVPESNSGKIIAPFVFGLTFGIASSPCGTPFLAGILALISKEHNLVLGGASLFCYAMGQGVLFVVIGMFTGLIKHLSILRHVGVLFTKLSASLFIVFGAMLIALGAGKLQDILVFLHLF